ncbi:uncharacterized protein LOC111708620 [Eurytemora carolleeae]|uniref:uncharacterized protein LOC111708620 n=1 Tax=Eurytemora carolleeae TaxID=1294199 RepID=UPI000C758463|nr:uncharacterized protein LOC111708620 [Eurytemora carolleeae]|eukprot:XP_023337823.1 uncharacterized protein LOC111708620 [Eurytemora affinis]
MVGEVAVVSGASYGIGRHISKQLAAKGWHVALLARGLAQLTQVQEEITQAGGVALALQCDITDRNAVRACKQRIEDDLGTPTVLINNAAYVAPLHKFAEGNPEEWEKMISVNVWGTLNLTREILPSMLEKKRGKIIFMSSKAGVVPTPYLAVHSGTKHMVEGLVGALIQEIAGSGVSVSLVRPGGVATPGYTHAVESGDGGSVPDWIPGNFDECIKPETVAEAVLFIVEQMEHADISEINVTANTKIKE